MNYLEEQTDEEEMINSIKNCDQPLPRVTQVSIAETTSTEQPPLKGKSMWSDQEKRVQKIDHLARSLLIQGLSNDIYSLIDNNKTAKDLWDVLARHMLGFEYGEQDRKAVVLYEYETFKATEGELLLDTYIRYLQVINDLKKCGYLKYNYELNFKFLNNLQPEWKQLKKQKKDDEDKRLLLIFKQIHINLPFLEAMIHMLKGAKVDTVNHDGKWTEEEKEDSSEVFVVSFYQRTESVEPLKWKAPENQLKPSSVKPPKLELKEFPEYLEYAFLQENNQLPVVISSALSTVKKARLLEVVPKKGGITVVKNEKDELISQRTVTGLRVCIDYHKLDNATRKDHFSLSFIDQMLKFLAGHEYYCFLDRFLGYFHIPIAPEDQEKTTFICPYGTFTYKRIPFGLCNAPATFQCCMTAIFHELIEDNMEAFMDDFSVFGSYFDHYLKNLEKMLKRCEETKLVLNWEKCHFMVKEGIVLEHKVSVLGQRIDNNFKPTYYASKTMNEAQENYTTTKKELLADVFAFDKFQQYLVLSKTIVFMDHSAMRGTSGGHHGIATTTRKLFEAGFYWPHIFRDARKLIQVCDACQRAENISSRDETPQKYIQICEIFDV
nr:RNA-directed DNA polymerase homolog [Tanacetum cinerariifolium]